MRKYFLLLLTCFMYSGNFAQNAPAAPCCNIILKNAKNNNVVARDQTTGRLYSFQVNATDIKSIVTGDIVDVDQLSSTVTAIRGSTRNYAVIEADKAQPVGILTSFTIDYADPVNGFLYTMKNKAENASFSNIAVYRSKALSATPISDIVSTNVNTAEPIAGIIDKNIQNAEPCCSIISIEPDPAEPCCAVVSFKNGLTGLVSQFKAPKNISNTLQVGDPVYAEPVNSIRVGKSEQSDAQPCCNVVSVRPDPAEPCCNIVTYKNNSTGASFQFRANKKISTIKIGEPLYAEPINDFAIVQSSYGSPNGTMNSYGYGATSSDNSSGNSTSSEKWVITPVTNMKGVLGKLNINYPPDVDRDIEIYQPAETFITSVSKNDKQYTMAPGHYRFLITTVPVDDVPIQKGHETRLKIGFLNIVSEGVWDLHTESKDKQYTSGNRPRRIALPIGNYQLRLGTQFYPVTIKDKETVEL
ncbi:MAG: hypothetical protein ACXWV9_00470 [Flavisolibacter sp.]